MKLRDPRNNWQRVAFSRIAAELRSLRCGMGRWRVGCILFRLLRRA